ncbi:hypothetical protein Tel_02865 [Candidatus Tenderia electrophaga]|uniref:O-antigen ligase-related domain-containing protein n=1 Tax=Candidatus Tenderia electrophaga TaxID=1748243 RepID=A0A0S2TAJ9_9GAMM|nr:hypothetical protein Tel_02865 [Candidatus Tenderia electrophaga]
MGVFKERFIHVLIFLFPIAGVGVRHWFSGIFVILALMSLWDLFKRKGRPALFEPEKIWLWLCAGFFMSIVASGVVNGWGETQSKSLGVDIRYLLIVPMYFMLRQYPHAWRWLLAGLLPAAVYVAGHAYYEVVELNKFRADGVYSPNLFGPVAALIAIWLLASWGLWGRLRWLLPVLSAAALWAALMSGSRGAYMGLVAMTLVWILARFRGWSRLLLVGLLMLVAMLCYQASDRVAERVNTAVTDVQIYFERLEQGASQQTSGTAIRFEMWRAGWMVFQDNPVFGVGWGNYNKAVQPYIDAERLSKNVARHDHAHNAYVEVLMSLGLVGFMLFLGMLFYPIYHFIKTYTLSPESALFGLLHVTGIAVFSLTDASILLKGNFVAIYLLCLSVFLSWHAAAIYNRQSDASTSIS